MIGENGFGVLNRKMAASKKKLASNPSANIHLLEESWEEKFLQAAINLQGSSSSCEVKPCCNLLTRGNLVFKG
jgi:hypothetical protein